MTTKSTIPTILFRIDFIHKGNNLVELKDFTRSTSIPRAEQYFQHRRNLRWWFDSPSITHNIVEDEQWIAEHPEEYQAYLDYVKNIEEKKRKQKEKKQQRLQDEEDFENEQEVQDRVHCPRCGDRMDTNSDFCPECGYPSEQMPQKKSWFTRALYIEGKTSEHKE